MSKSVTDVLIHSPNQCKAISAICWTCQKRGHYSAACRQKNVFQMTSNSQTSIHDEFSPKIVADLNSLQVDDLF